MDNHVAKRWEGDGEAGVNFWCPGCNRVHSIRSEGPRSNWGFNGDYEKPTFTPSVLVTRPAKPDAPESFKEYREGIVCHSFVTNGQIQFLGDCTHKLANQTVPLPLLSTWRYD